MLSSRFKHTDTEDSAGTQCACTIAVISELREQRSMGQTVNHVLILA